MAGIIDLDPTLQLVLTITGVVGIFATSYAVFRTTVTKATIVNYKELVDSYAKRIDDLEQKSKDYQQLHLDNVRMIGELQGQLSVLKDIPLQDIAQNQREIAKTLEVLTHHWGITPSPKDLDNAVHYGRRKEDKVKVAVIEPKRKNDTIKIEGTMEGQVK